MAKELLVLFDGNSLVHRAYHALAHTGKSLTLKTGEVVGAVYVFASMLLKVLGELKPSCIAVAFDRAAPTFRHLEFADYKKNRPETPDELVPQLHRVRDLVKAFNLPAYELDGYEADDILGTIARRAHEKGIPTIIVTGDADMMQLVQSGIKVLYPNPGKPFSDTTLFDEDAVKEKYGITPDLIADFKALKGDATDNIPGVPGVGEVTAVKLIQEFGGIKGIYEHIDEVKSLKIRGALKVMETLKQYEAQAQESLRLATIVTDAPVDFDLDKCQLSRYDRGRVIELFRELGFFSLVERLPDVEGVTETLEAPAPVAPLKCDYNIISDEEALKVLAIHLREAGSFAFDTETDSLDVMRASLVGISFSVKPGEADYIPLGHKKPGGINQLPLPVVLDYLRPVMSEASLRKTAHNGKYDMTVMAEHGVNTQNLAFDTMVAAYLLGEKSLSLKALSLSFLGLEMTPISDLIGEGKKEIPMSEVTPERVAEYCSADVDMTLRLSELFRNELEKQGLWRLFAEIEMPLVPVLSAMERNGVMLDTGLLRKMSEELGAELNALEEEIFKSAGHEFNINSTQQLGAVLFEELGLPAARKTKSGYSTDAAVLEELRRTLPESENPKVKIITLVLDYRTLSKLKSTYIDALPEMVSPRTGRLHTSFNQTKTTTGRLSSSDPNLQNIPVRGERGKEIRKAFIAPPGSYLLSGDYSQIDLRSLAHLSQDPRLIQAFREGKDAHATTAGNLFQVPQEKVNSDMRRLAKTVNFGVIYGMSDYGLEQATELSREEARRFIASYFAEYPGVKSYLDATKKQARDLGYVQTIMNRRRYIPEINSPNRQVREAAERMAINMPVQGTSADIIKVAMVSLHREIEKRALKSRMILQVHDELIFEVPESELELMSKLVPDIMASAVILSVPIKVDIKMGRDWGEMD